MEPQHDPTCDIRTNDVLMGEIIVVHECDCGLDALKEKAAEADRLLVEHQEHMADIAKLTLERDALREGLDDALREQAAEAVVIQQEKLLALRQDKERLVEALRGVKKKCAYPPDGDADQQLSRIEIQARAAIDAAKGE